MAVGPSGVTGLIAHQWAAVSLIQSLSGQGTAPTQSRTAPQGSTVQETQPKRRIYVSIQSLPLYLSCSASLYLSHSHSISHSASPTPSPSLHLPHSISVTASLSLCLSLPLPPCLPLSPSVCLPHSASPTPSPLLCLSHSASLTPSPSFCLSHSASLYFYQSSTSLSCPLFLSRSFFLLFPSFLLPSLSPPSSHLSFPLTIFFSIPHTFAVFYLDDSLPISTHTIQYCVSLSPTDILECKISCHILWPLLLRFSLCFSALACVSWFSLCFSV